MDMFSAVNTSRQDFTGILLEAETTLATFLLNFQLELMLLAWICTTLGEKVWLMSLSLTLPTFMVLPLNVFFYLSEVRTSEASRLKGRKMQGGGWVKQTGVCVHQAFFSWCTDPGSIDTLRSVGTVWSRETHGQWTQISCRKRWIIRELEWLFRNRWKDGGDMCGRGRERERRKSEGRRDSLFGWEGKLNA